MCIYVYIVITGIEEVDTGNDTPHHRCRSRLKHECSQRRCVLSLKVKVKVNASCDRLQGGGSSDFICRRADCLVGFAKVGEGCGGAVNLHCRSHGELWDGDRAFLKHADRGTVLIQTSPFECNFARLVYDQVARLAQGEMGNSDGTSMLNRLILV